MTSSFVELALSQIQESSTNPRKRFTQLDELAASIKQVGILEPLLVRPVNGHHELVAGARRFRAAQIAGLEVVPCIVRELDDHAALEAQIVENLQRAAVHPLDEADGYRALMAADRAYTVDAIAARMGKSVSYVRNRLKFGQLVPAVREAFETDRITAGHALVIARLDPKLQTEALEECFGTLWRGDDETEVLQAVAELESWINRNYALDVKAPETAELFPDVVQTAKAIAATGGTLLPLTRHYYASDPKLKPEPLTSGQWRELDGKKDACGSTVLGVIVLGYDRGHVIQVCASKECAKHWPELQRTATTKAGEPQPKRELTAHKKQAQKERQLAQALGKVKAPALGQLLEQFKGQALTNELAAFAMEAVLPFGLREMLGGAAGTKRDWTSDRLPQLLAFAKALHGTYTLGRLAVALKKHGIDVEKLAAEAAPRKAAKAKGRKVR